MTFIRGRRRQNPKIPSPQQLPPNEDSKSRYPMVRDCNEQELIQFFNKVSDSELKKTYSEFIYDRNHLILC